MPSALLLEMTEFIIVEWEKLHLKQQLDIALT
jgi:hypothetical protein